MANLWLWDLDLASVPASHLRALAAAVSFSVTLAKVEAASLQYQQGERLVVTFSEYYILQKLTPCLLIP